MGRLGNVMFQIAGTEYLGNKYNFKTGYFNLDSLIKSKHTNEYLNMFENFNWPSINHPPGLNFEASIGFFGCTEVPFHYEPFNVVDNTTYNSMFQSEKYFPNRKFIQKLFEPSDEVKSYLKNKYGDVSNYTSLHVRRTDYIQKASFHPPCSIEYYERALDMIQGNVLVFSDDLNWCKENFLGNRFTFISGNRDYQDLFLMSMCKNNIIANSSFSWWGAWLNTNKAKICLYPSNLNPSNNFDFWPKEWVSI